MEARSSLDKFMRIAIMFDMIHFIEQYTLSNRNAQDNFTGPADKCFLS